MAAFNTGEKIKMYSEGKLSKVTDDYAWLQDGGYIDNAGYITPLGYKILTQYKSLPLLNKVENNYNCGEAVVVTDEYSGYRMEFVISVKKIIYVYNQFIDKCNQTMFETKCKNSFVKQIVLGNASIGQRVCTPDIRYGLPPIIEIAETIIDNKENITIHVPYKNSFRSNLWEIENFDINSINIVCYANINVTDI